MSDFLAAMQWHISQVTQGQTEALLACVFFLSGLAAVWSFFYQLRIRRWPSVQGNWMEAEVGQFGAQEISVSDRNYVIEARYQYSVNGEAYRGHRFSPWEVVATTNLKWILARQLKQVDPMHGFNVFYNPGNPAKSFLVKPGKVGLVATLLYALVFVYSPILIWQQIR